MLWSLQSSILGSAPPAPILFRSTATTSSGGAVGNLTKPAGVAAGDLVLIVIPGSAGQPRDGNPAACYAMFEPQAQRITYHRVPYDHETAAAKIRAAGLPERLAARLFEGV